MDDLSKLEDYLVEKLHEIREKENKTLYDRQEYEETQKELRKVHDVEIMLTRFINEEE